VQVLRGSPLALDVIVNAFDDFLVEPGGGGRCLGRPAAIAIAALGGFSLLVGAILGPNEAIAGAAVFIAAALLAMREPATPTMTWPSAIADFALVIWLVPARGYRLPISLPFNLEPYRSSWRRFSSRCS
jgi:polysaccharide biosynthesis protein PslJ